MSNRGSISEKITRRRGPLRAERTLGLAESVIREMTRLALEHGAVNLSQGYPDFPASAAIKNAAKLAIDADINQYSITWGAKSLRDALARKVSVQFGWELDPEREITVVCGATEGMFASFMALLNPGDEVVIFEPFYENYGPDCALTGAVPRHVSLRPPDWSFSVAELEAAFTSRTRAIVLNTPNNPTGKVFSRQELESIAGLCRKHDVVAITDEIYEHILYDGHRHISIATLEGMRERTVTISSLSKTYSVTGWRVGWVIAPPELTDSIRKVHDFLTVNSPAPLQEAAAAAISFGEDYYRQLAADYTHRRDRLLGILESCGFNCYRPAGAYYIMTDISALSYPNDTEFVKHLIKNIGVAAVPGSSFYQNPENGAQQVRFTFCKKAETLDEAERHLQKLRPGR
ncbi:MAG: aminotransferase class I/II-fold pyridoxal phosphate-dependent enzyme [Acidobacteria bacterium]|nr:aminotransferase class I/II-fold pyridoxal phosphate-dependent enzyme [Acidobacteriota bacterium]